MSSGNVSANWKKFRQKYTNYEIATGVSEKESSTRVATLLTVIGNDAMDVYNTLLWDAEGDDNKINKVLTKFEEFCEPKKNVSYERYVFFARAQDSGESIDQYVTVLKRLCESCDFGTLRNYLIKDRIELGINNHETRGRLLREADFTLEKALELVRAADATEKHMIAINNDVTVHGIHNRRRKLTAKKTNPSQPEKTPSTQPQRRSTFNCRNCGTKHGKKEMSRYRKNLPSLSEAKSIISRTCAGQGRQYMDWNNKKTIYKKKHSSWELSRLKSKMMNVFQHSQYMDISRD